MRQLLGLARMQTIKRVGFHQPVGESILSEVRLHMIFLHKWNINKKSLKEATADVMSSVCHNWVHRGGVVALDKNGNMSLEFNTAGMYRASMNDKGETPKNGSLFSLTISRSYYS